MGQTTFSGPVRSERGFTAVGSTAVVDITAETTLTYADHVGRIMEDQRRRWCSNTAFCQHRDYRC